MQDSTQQQTDRVHTVFQCYQLEHLAQGADTHPSAQQVLPGAKRLLWSILLRRIYLESYLTLPSAKQNCT
jgi:hypothetical protein